VEANMQIERTTRVSRLHVVAAILFTFALAAGCAKQKESEATGAFKTPEEAAATFVAKLESNDVASLTAMLGPDSEGLLDSGDAVQDAGARAGFVADYKTKHALVDDGADRKVLVVGEQDWPLPIPLVRTSDGWRFDGEAGIEELIYRRVGANELGAIAVCRGFVDAQIDYASTGHDGDPAGIYALKLVSDEGLHNGLYWPVEEGEPPSPAGPFVASAAAEGYRRAEGERRPYHGYYYRMLYAQGPNANGGARDYFRNGVLTEGFALVAWPADYGSSGVMTFIVNQDGVVFQKDLGEDTSTAVEAITTFDPDASWTATVPETDDDDA
jgi:Protein of unknown function (DUF2950)